MCQVLLFTSCLCLFSCPFFCVPLCSFVPQSLCILVCDFVFHFVGSSFFLSPVPLPDPCVSSALLRCSLWTPICLQICFFSLAFILDFPLPSFCSLHFGPWITAHHQSLLFLAQPVWLPVCLFRLSVIKQWFTQKWGRKKQSKTGSGE